MERSGFRSSAITTSLAPVKAACSSVKRLTTLNPVPVVLFQGPQGAALRDGGVLADLAPTLLELMGLEQPAEMTGSSLIAG